MAMRALSASMHTLTTAPHVCMQVRLRVLDQLRETYRPEFLNRLGELILFQPLQRRQLQTIAQLTLVSLQRRLAAREVTLRVTDAALGVLADLGYSPEYGARPLKRVVQKELETPLARGLVAGEYLDGDTLEVDADFDQASLRIKVVRRGSDGDGADEDAEEEGEQDVRALSFG